MRYERSVESYEVVVVGAGSAGLAAAALLQQHGLRPLVLEAGREPGAAWRERYDRLHPHTPRLLSGLPGRRIPRRFARWVPRADVLDRTAKALDPGSLGAGASAARAPHPPLGHPGGHG